jgi:hypothetical protein
MKKRLKNKRNKSYKEASEEKRKEQLKEQILRELSEVEKKYPTAGSSSLC